MKFLRPARAKAFIRDNAFALAGRLSHIPHTQGDALGYGLIGLSGRLCRTCAFKNLSPSCHPCHPQKRVQTPCASAFCHPDTLKCKICSVIRLVCSAGCVQTIANKGEKMGCFRTQNGCVRTQCLDLRQQNGLFPMILAEKHCQSGKSPYLCIVKRK